MISSNMMEDITVDVGKPLYAKNLKSMGLIDRVRVEPSKLRSWEALKDHIEREDEMYLFSKIEPPKVISCYLMDLEAQGIDISGFILD